MSDDFYSFSKLQTLLQSVKGKFVYLILAKWYLLIVIPAFWVTYYFFDKLETTGILTKIHDFIEKKLNLIVVITRECTPRIINLQEYYQCINSIN